jgi:hypothetical protein
MLPEPPDCAEASAELRKKSWPTHLNVALQGVESIGKPDIDINHHRPRPYGSQCTLGDRHHALVFGHGLPARFFNAVLDDELVNLGHIDTVTDVSDPQPWNLRAEAIWRY